ncbi:MAG: retroviral-like aspartic protease family protein [Alphaproteobacteria bacterium]|nr:retroviral-like aspartic protease family protein [Alphaproteobacteria bacterium]
MKGWAGVAVVTAVLMSTPGYAADRGGGCGAMRLGETAVAMLRNEPIVKVSADGAPVVLLLDTGAEATVLTPAAAQRVGTERSGVTLGREVHGITGDLPTAELDLRSFRIGGVEAPRRRVRIAPIEIVNDFTGPLDGVLGADTLSSFDIDLDLPGRRMILYREQSCAAAAPAWAPPYARIAAGRSPSNRLYFPVQLDGRTINALFDTGAQFSVLSMRAAQALGVTEAVLARDPPVIVRGAVGEELGAHAHRFSRLEVDGDVIRNADIDVTELRLGEADLVLGIDFLETRRVWLSYGSQQLFLMRRI